ncbi:hypothetical protein, partial [Methylomonas koyamae]|uniref:hypothetical protein n=1 Tax=Methylomonas koyamae TaxID=702114 RepID=UPI000B10562A
MKDFNRPATTEEIAEAMGKLKRTVQIFANNEGWKFTELQTKGRYKRRLYALKDLPQDISEKISFNRL